jgi:hypothetical protein
MDQDAYRATYRDMNERYCLFEKGVLAGQCTCPLAERFYLAEREGVHCGSDPAQSQCEEWLKLVRQHARFALKSQDDTSILPHAKAMRMQVGGLRGLYLATCPGQALPAVIDDIHGLISAAVAQFQTLEEVPFQEVIKQIASYQGRKRRKKR